MFIGMGNYISSYNYILFYFDFTQIISEILMNLYIWSNLTDESDKDKYIEYLKKNALDVCQTHDNCRFQRSLIDLLNHEHLILFINISNGRTYLPFNITIPKEYHI